MSPQENISDADGRPVLLDRAKVSLKDALYLACFVFTAAVSWGMVINANGERDKEVASLKARVDRNEDSLNRLINEVTKVSRDTEWIRDYLKRNQDKP